MALIKCISVEQARQMFPKLNNVPAVEIEASDGILVFFTKKELTQEDRDFFKSYTRKEIMDCVEI